MRRLRPHPVPGRRHAPGAGYDRGRVRGWRVTVHGEHQRGLHTVRGSAEREPARRRAERQPADLGIDRRCTRRPHGARRNPDRPPRAPGQTGTLGRGERERLGGGRGRVGARSAATRSPCLAAQPDHRRDGHPLPAGARRHRDDPVELRRDAASAPLARQGIGLRTGDSARARAVPARGSA